MAQLTINRESGDKGKGFRLQKLRAIKLLLDEMNRKEQVFVYAATEYYEDVFFKTVENDKVREYAEGDKNYDPERSFSFMSGEVRNSMVSFLDCWLNQKMSKSLVFGFYTNIKIAKEKNTDYTRSLGITLPDKPIIKLLMDRNFGYPNLFDTVKKVLIDEYKQQYDGKALTGYTASIDSLKDELWIDFLGRIDWKFEKEDDLELEQILLQDIRNSKLYTLRVEGKESYILAALEQEFEKRQNLPDHLARLVSHSDVKTIFLEIANDVYKRNDPVYEEWENMEPPEDKRNLNAKIESVCSTYPPKKLGLFARKIGAVKKELKKVDNKDRGSYLYRIFEACEEKLFELADEYAGQDLPPETIDFIIDELVTCAEQHLADKSKDYSYPFKNRDTLRNAILDLFDNCFLAFD